MAVSPNIYAASSMRSVSPDTRIKEATYLIRSKAITEIFEARVIAFRTATKSAELFRTDSWKWFVASCSGHSE